MHDRRGFTVLELMMVVVIIGILASVSIPQYLKVVERAKMSEASSTLGQLRASEARYRAASPALTYTKTLSELDYDPADVAGTNIFTYAGVTGTPADFSITATRNAAPPVGGNCKAGYVLSINAAGLLTGQDCQQ